jgi:tRNA uridine 5-carboxymethylaminomethyl modification enzyme
MQTKFDVIVVGGGHAGIEAAWTAAHMGSKTLLVTLKLDRIGQMSCNPAIGGIGKSHIVFEISALGGLMPKLCTKTYLQARMLNTRKGPAVHGLRLQIDKELYKQVARQYLDAVQTLTLCEGEAERVLMDGNRACGVIIDGKEYQAPCVILTTGTFLDGQIHVGEKHHPGGRYDEPAVKKMSDFLKSLNLEMDRLKTGTPARIQKDSIDYSKMTPQGSDELEYLYEFYPNKVIHKHDCFITYTNERTHAIIAKNAHRSAIHAGNIKGKPPRYCPSIEDKIVRFAHKTSHHIFIEPESLSIDEMYPNGISTSLPAEVQEEFIHTIPGLEDARIAKYAYAIEYDFVYPNQLHHWLELKKYPGLFLAGQINGTTGYEEAAGQGLIAGINAHKKAHQQEPFVLDRQESYIGIMIDDLVTMSIDEPYRMFTSRAERRIILRQDNTFLRLMDKGYQLGLIEQTLYQDFVKEKEDIHAVLTNNEERTLGKRAQLTVEAERKYAPYIERELKEIVKVKKYQELIIPATFVYKELPGLSIELQQKLERHQPTNIEQASRIPGMTPAAISLLIWKINAFLNHKSVL